MVNNPLIVKTHNISMAEAAGRCGALWKALTEEEKKPYVEKNTADKKRVESQLRDIATKGYFLLETGQKSCEVRAIQKTDLKPKRAGSAYTFFVAEKVGPYMAEHKCSCGEAMKKVSIMWNALSDSKKKPYTDRNAQEKERQTA